MTSWSHLHTELQNRLKSGLDQINQQELGNLLLRLEVQLIELDYDSRMSTDVSVEHCLRLVLGLLPLQLFPEREIRILNRAARWCERQGLSKLAAAYYETLISVSHDVGQTSTWIQGLQEFGDFVRKSGEFVKAEEYQLKAATLAKENGFHQLHAHSMNNIAVIAIETGDLGKATTCFEQAMELLEVWPEPQLTGHILNNLGVIYCIKGQPDQAILELNRALVYRSTAGDSRGIAETSHNLGMASMDLDHLDAAEEYLERALTLCRSLSDKQIEANIQLSRAELFNKQGNPVIAGSIALAAKQLHEKLGDPLGIADALRIYAETEYELMRYEVAQRALQKPLKVYREFNHLHGLAQCCELMSYIEAKSTASSKIEEWVSESIRCWTLLSNDSAVNRLKLFLESYNR